MIEAGIAAIVRNEGPYLLEWIAFHRVVGFSHFVIADHGSDDGGRILLAQLEEAGLATVIDIPRKPGDAPQLAAYSRLLQEAPATLELLAFIDADEFILPSQGDSMQPLLQKLFAPPDVSALALNWASFGSAGRLFGSAAPVLERFTRRAPREFAINRHYKSIVRRGRVAGFGNPHHPDLYWGRRVDALGADLQPGPEEGGGLSAGVQWEGARINHYAVRSVEEFLCKAAKGSASQPDRIKHQAYFELHDRNDEDCGRALSLLPAVRLEMQRLAALLKPPVAAG